MPGDIERICIWFAYDIDTGLPGIVWIVLLHRSAQETYQQVWLLFANGEWHGPASRSYMFGLLTVAV